MLRVLLWYTSRWSSNHTSTHLFQDGNYPCSTCELSPHSCVTGKRYSVLVSSSLMNDWQGNMEKKRISWRLSTCWLSMYPKSNCIIPPSRIPCRVRSCKPSNWRLAGGRTEWYSQRQISPAGVQGYWALQEFSLDYLRKEGQHFHIRNSSVPSDVHILANRLQAAGCTWQ